MRADFYLIQKPRFRNEPLLLVCELAAKASEAGMSCVILARDSAQAELLDDLLWSFKPDAFVPHQIFDPEMMDEGDDGDDGETMALIVTPEHDVPLPPLVINLRDAAVEGSFERVLEVVPADESARGPLRERWKQYQARGFELNKHDM
ncbi:MAG TPA: DNA polymerase III subunit chi [Lysobacter sp.]|nr:DNA polymerase III subunit chi [Lysobacter sp.]